MAKFRRKVVGSVVKNKDTSKPDYIKIRGDMLEDLSKALKNASKEEGLFLNLESQKFQEANLDNAVAEGKVKADNAEKARDRISKIPSFVRFEIVLVEKQDQ